MKTFIRITLIILFFTLSSPFLIKGQEQKRYKCSNHLDFRSISSNTDLRSDSVDILNYTISLDIRDIQNKSIKGNCKITLTPLLDNITTLCFDLFQLNIDSIKLSSETLSFDYNDTLLKVLVPNAININDTINLEIFYGGQPKQDAAWGGFYFSGNYAFNLGVGFESKPHNYGRIWFPCFDNFTERSTYNFNIITNSNKKALCNGELIRSVDIGTDSTLHEWKMEEPIPTYLACVAVADYKLLNSIHQGINKQFPILLAAEASDTIKLKNSFVNLGNTINTYENSYGPYQWNKVGYSLVPFNSGAMEHATNIAYPRYAADGSLLYETLMAHELSHHWWGNLVTCQDAENMWINEGMASFSEYLFTENIYGKDAYQKALKLDLDNVLHKAHIQENGYRAIFGIPHEYTYGDHVYKKGALVAHTLRTYLGDSLFFYGLKSFLENNKFKDVNSIDLRDGLASYTGKDLTDFFNNWVFNGGFPHFSIDSLIISPEQNEFRTKVYVKQKLTGAPSLYNNVPLEFMFMDVNWNKYYHTEVLAEEDSYFEVLLPTLPIYWEINPNNKIAQAVSSENKVINTLGSTNFHLPRLNLDIQRLSDSAYLNIEHHWSAPDSLIQTSSKLSISDYRYWKIDGIIPLNFKASTRFYYDGRNSFSGSNGNLDTFLGQSEDSIILLFRKTKSEIWRAFPNYTQNKLGSSTNKHGYFQVDSILLGEYTFGYGDASLLSIQENSQIEKPLHIYPNPANTLLNIKIPNESAKQFELQIIDFNGRIIYQEKTSSQTMQIDIQKWDNGYYLVKCIANKEEYTGKICIKK